MYSRDPELFLQCYREDIADEELFARPAPLEVLAEAVRKWVTRIGRRLTPWAQSRKEDHCAERGL
jgi:hypothetical protein